MLDNTENIDLNNKYLEKLKKCSEQMIFNDGRTVSSLILNMEKNAIISLLLLPYVGLYCREAQEYYNIKVLDEESDSQVIDLRNSIKVICSKYSKIENAFLESDSQQDEMFRDLLRFDFTKPMNVHYNLGIYFDENGNIIGDTQLISYYLNSVDIAADTLGLKAFEISKKLGRVMRIIMMHSGHRRYERKTVKYETVKIGYIDYNTNIENNLFKKNNKGINLIILHMLGMVGTNKYILRRVLYQNNVWMLRNEYIITHNIWTGLRTIYRHFQMEKSCGEIDSIKLGEIVNEGAKFFPSQFRNVMIHYDLTYKGNPCISEEEYKPDIPLYGLVETNFRGKSSKEYFHELRIYMERVEEYMRGWFSIDKSRIKWDL